MPSKAEQDKDYLSSYLIILTVSADSFQRIFYVYFKQKITRSDSSKRVFYFKVEFYSDFATAVLSETPLALKASIWK